MAYTYINFLNKIDIPFRKCKCLAPTKKELFINRG